MKRLARKYYPGMGDSGRAEVKWLDDEDLEFGDDGDVTVSWNSADSVLEFLPLTDDVGAINIGNGTLDIDFKVFLGDTLNYFECDVSNQRLLLQRTGAGSGSARGFLIEVAVLAGDEGWRQGGLIIDMERDSGEDFGGAWDGNPDTALKIYATNRAVNAADRGVVRCIDVQARTRGTSSELATAEAAIFGARVDTTCEVDALHGIFITLEAYGIIDTEAVGLDINMLIENDSGGGVRTGIRIRNTDQSAQSAVENAFLISHTSTNGFVNLFYFNAATGDTASAGTLTDSGAGDILCDARIKCSINNVDYWIPLFDTAP